MAAIQAAIWAREAGGGAAEDLEEEIEWIRDTIRNACNASMPRVRPSPRKTAYWWTEEIADLRCSSVRTSRAARRAETLEAALEAHRAARYALSAAIRKEKARV